MINLEKIFDSIAVHIHDANCQQGANTSASSDFYSLIVDYIKRYIHLGFKKVRYYAKI